MASEADGTRTFYRDLPPFSAFDRFADFSAYAEVPDDWVVLVTDVRGSTQAIRDGRYKDVNMVGAASITAVLNVSPGAELPFVFGGDGATLVVPRDLRETALDALIRLQAASTEMFGLELRVGAVPVADLRARDADLRVRKFELSPRNHLALFAGRGLELADSLIKDPDPANPYLAPAPENAARPDLAGLSCRWEPLVPRNGRMMALMVRAVETQTHDESTELSDVLGEIARILGHDIAESAPASPSSLRFRWPPRGLAVEARATAGQEGFWRRYLGILVETLIQYACEKLNLKAGGYDAPVYREELRANTDFRKFDGILRAVLDVTEDQAEAIKAYLEREYWAGRLIYGTHLADRALMTCLLFSLEDSEHVHFIDAAGGGFAMAARGFKDRAAALISESPPA